MLADLADAIETADQARLAEFERYLDAVEQDVELLGPKIEAACRATDVLSVKAGWLEELLLIEAIRDYLGLDVELAESLCGGLLGKATVVVEPTPDTLRPGDQVQLSATILGPADEELVGQVQWVVLPTGLTEVDQSGLVTALQHGTGQVIAVATDLHVLDGSVPLVVIGDLVVEVSPTQLTLAAGESGVLDAVVRLADSGQVDQDVFVEWTIGDTSMFHGVTSNYTRRITLEAQHRGNTEVTVCVTGTGYCASVPLTSVFNIGGLWSFEETLEVDLDPPETETCDVVGTVQITQTGAAYIGSSDETSTCTYDRGDGSAPEVVVVRQQGNLRAGTITVQGGFYHETYYPAEACRTSGWVTSSGAFSWATSVSGTTECLEDDIYYSVGPMSGSR